MAAVTLTGVMFGVDSTMAVIIFLLAAVRIVLTLMQNKIALSYRTLLNPLERKESYICLLYTSAERIHFSVRSGRNAAGLASHWSALCAGRDSRRSFPGRGDGGGLGDNCYSLWEKQKI